MGHALSCVLSYLLPRAALAAWLRGIPPPERVTLALLAGLIWLFAVHMTGLLLGAPFSARQAIAASVLVVAAGGNLARRRVVGIREEVGVFGWVLAPAAWMLVCAATLPVLYGGGWQGDWLEHYQRMRYFLDPSAPRGFDVTSRPPFVNLVMGAYAGAVGSSFASYQVLHAFLGVLALLPASLLYAFVARDARPRTLALCFGLLILHPVVAANALYPWSRMLTTFCVLTGLFFYLRAHLEGDHRLYAVAFLALGAAVVGHFSSATLVVVIGVHFLYSVARRRVTPRELVMALGAWVPTVGLWLVWSITHFGWARTFASHTTAQNIAASGPAGIVQQWAYNLSTTVIPFWDWDRLVPYVRQESLAGWWYDFLHLYWAGTLVGSVSGPLILALLAGRVGKGLPSGFTKGREARFLLVLLAVTFFASFLTIPNREVAGISHLALQPLALVAFVLGLACIQQAKPWVPRFFVCAYFAEGWLLYLLKTFDRTGLTAEQLSWGFGINARIKQDHHLLFIFDRVPEAAGVLRVLVLLSIPLLFVWAWRGLELARADAGPRPATGPGA